MWIIGLSVKQRASSPIQRAARLIFDDARLKEITLLLEIQHFAHPGKRIGGSGVKRLDPDLLAAPVRDKAQILLEHRRVQSEHAARHRILGVAILELD